MTIEVQVSLPNGPPVCLDDYANTLALVAIAGTHSQFLTLPDEFHYDNPKTGTTVDIIPAKKVIHVINKNLTEPN